MTHVLISGRRVLLRTLRVRGRKLCQASRPVFVVVLCVYAVFIDCAAVINVLTVLIVVVTFGTICCTTWICF